MLRLLHMDEERGKLEGTDTSFFRDLCVKSPSVMVFGAAIPE